MKLCFSFSVVVVGGRRLTFIYFFILVRDVGVADEPINSVCE